MAFLDKTGVTTLVTKLKDYFALKTEIQEKLVSGTNIKTINNNDILGSGNLSISVGNTISYVSRTYSFTAKSAGASGYFQITWSSPLLNRPFAVNVHTTSISALNGTQFSVVNATTSGCYITYYCPGATTSTISLTIYGYYYR